jgi:predicted nucleotidyltransferase
LIKTEEIATLTADIVSVCHPEKIVLFGSYVYGKPTDQSDIDLLVVVKKLDVRKNELLNKIHKRILGKYLFKKDIKLCTVREIQEWQNVKNAFLTSVIQHGKVIYEK